MLTSTAVSAAAQDANTLFDGEWRYNVSCASCHGADGEGISAFGPSLTDNPFVANSPADLIITVIQEGRYNRSKAYRDYAGMPAFYYIRAGEARALVDYMKNELGE
jgi:mono/diheme cytochrome c family protein